MSNQKTLKRNQVICANIIGSISNYSIDKNYYLLNSEINKEVNLSASGEEWKNKYISEMCKLKLDEIALSDENGDIYNWKEETLRVKKFDGWKYFGANNITQWVKHAGITKLVLWNCNLKTIPKEIGKMIDLKYIDLSHNELKILPLELGDLYNLKKLYLQENQLEEIPSELFSRVSKNGKNFNLIKLKELFLGSNKLKNMPDSICNLINLENLQVENNQFSEIPKIEKLINLRCIDFGRNQIEIFSEEMCNLTKLKYIKLSRNKISNLPKNLDNLSKLKYIDLGGNFINYIPIELTKCLKLDNIFLKGNPITKIPIEIILSKRIDIDVDSKNLTLGTKIICIIYAFIVQILLLFNIELKSSD